MENISWINRLNYSFQGILLWTIHWTDRHHVFGLRAATLLKLLFLALPFVALLRRWASGMIIITVVLFLIIQLVYWQSRRLGYYRFVAGPPPGNPQARGQKLPANQRIPIEVTGIFGVLEYEKNILLHPAHYWQVPLGEHGVMVQHEPGRYLYQFFNATTLQDIQCGWLLYGSKPKPALAITYLSTWGPEFNELNLDLLGRPKQKPVTKIRRIFFSFNNQEAELAVWKNILFDRQSHQQDVSNVD